MCHMVSGAGGTTGLGVMEGSHLDGSSLEGGSESQIGMGSRENRRRHVKEDEAQASLWRESVHCTEGQQNGKGSIRMEVDGMEDKFRIPRCMSSCPVPANEESVFKSCPPREFSLHHNFKRNHNLSSRKRAQQHCLPCPLSQSCLIQLVIGVDPCGNQ